jgi:hypothetical protein
MRTTLDIGDDVLAAAKERARRERKTAGQVITELARAGLNGAAAAVRLKEPKAVYGFRPLPKRGVVVTNELVDKLREDDAY